MERNAAEPFQARAISVARRGSSHSLGTVSMRYQDQINSMKACSEMFDSIGYAGRGRQGLARCIAAFEADDRERAIREYRQTIGDAPNFASAMTDLDTDKLPPEIHEQYFSRVLGVMFGMTLLMNGNVK